VAEELRLGYRFLAPTNHRPTRNLRIHGRLATLVSEAASNPMNRVDRPG